MKLEICLGTNEVLDDLTFASAVIELCESNVSLSCVKVAKAILLEMVGEDK
jgi:hypothetical protein